MNRVRRCEILTLLYLTGLCFCAVSYAANVDPNATWPLCGRITENPPAEWVATDGCPSGRFGDPTYSDEPLSSTFGPRPLFSENNRYDFHRGVDIATPNGTPFFAIADGTVAIAGEHPSYSDPLVSVSHFRPGEASCNSGGCYRSLYLHISNRVVNESDQVVKGQLLGYTGASSSGFQHLHFEVRDAPAADPFSAWSRDAIHPLSVLPYEAPDNTTIVFNDVDFSNPDSGRVDLGLTSSRYDLVALDLDLFDDNGQALPQSGDTPDDNGYYVEPSSFHMETWNFMYSHKNSSAYPWESFGAGGVNECPYHADHGVSYDANVHMDQQFPGKPLEGLFNGLHVRTLRYWPSDQSDYEVNLEFLALQGDASCVEATATFISGDTTTAQWGDCASRFAINAGLNDAWYYPETNGQGFFITVFPDIGFVSLAWFTYDTELPPPDSVANLGDAGHRWLTAIGPITGNQAVMNIEVASGGIFDTATEIARTDPPGSDGIIILTFENCNSGTIEYDIPSINQQGIVPIQRVAGDNIVICEALKGNMTK
jgi:murein DD-endopeptidase MepM/ murein hydrolase activator NlpD